MGQGISLSNTWSPVGPLNVQTAAYGAISGRVTAVAIDANDATGNTVCTVVSQYNDLSATGTVTVTLLTGATKQSRLGLVLLPTLLALPLCARRRNLRALAIVVIASALAVGASGCGADRVSAVGGTGSGTGTGSGGTSTGGSTTVVTPPGTYTITASATAAGVTHSVPLTLTVQ